MFDDVILVNKTSGPDLWAMHFLSLRRRCSPFEAFVYVILSVSYIRSLSYRSKIPEKPTVSEQALQAGLSLISLGHGHVRCALGFALPQYLRRPYILAAFPDFRGLLTVMQQPVYEWSAPAAIANTIATGGVRDCINRKLVGKTWHLEPSNASVGGFLVDGHYATDFTQDFSGGSWIKIRLQVSGHAEMSFDGSRRQPGVSGARLFVISHKGSSRKTQHFSTRSHEKVVTMRIDCDANGMFLPDIADGSTLQQDLSGALGETETLRSLALPRILQRQADTILQGMTRCPADVTQSRFLNLSDKCLSYVGKCLLGATPEPGLAGMRAERIVRTALDIIESDLASPPDLPRLCRLVGVNRNMLNTAFRQITGETAYTTLRGRRMEVAREALLGSSLSITEIGHLVGYTQLANFSAAYRQTFGISPSQEFERRNR
ncbi:AraC family transcriptional regulator [Rhodobacteraceae bacterium LMO-12]|nr:AraC family transcriptional regulator [Rhodobacteraceae bacterium LMO-JJ12]